MRSFRYEPEILTKEDDKEEAFRRLRDAGNEEQSSAWLDELHAVFEERGLVIDRAFFYGIKLPLVANVQNETNPTKTPHGGCGKNSASTLKTMSYFLTLVAFLVLISFESFAQNSQVTSSWLHTFGGGSIDKISSIETDSNGNTYALGSFMKEVNFGQEKTLVSEQHFSVFLEKISPEGELIWVHKVEHIVWGQGAGMAIESEDNVVISGSFFGTPFSTNSTSKSANQKTSFFVEKVNPLGESIWSFGLYTSGSAFGKTVAIDEANNIFIGGGFTGITDFEPIEKTHPIESKGGNDAFVLKLDQNANFEWVYTFGEQGEEATYLLAIDRAQRVHAAGSCGMNNEIPEHFGGIDGFIHQLDLNGERKWTKTIGGEKFDLINDIAFDSEYNLIVCGVFQEQMELTDQANGPFQVTVADHRNKWVDCTDAFILKYNQSGEISWARQFGGVNNDQFLDVEIDANDHILVGGSFERFAQLEDDQLINPRPGIKSHGKRDGIVAMYNPYGNLKWVHSFGSREQGVINAVSISNNNNVCIGGYFSG